MLRYALSGTLLLSSAASAGPTIAVVGLHQEELDLDAQKAAAAKIVAAIDGTGNFDALSPEEIAASLDGREELVLTDAFLAHGRKLLADGRLQFQQAEPDFAIPVLESAVKELAAAQPYTPTQKEYWEALVYLGASQNMVGDQAGTMQNFSAAAGINPERRPSPRQFPPDIIETYEGLAGGMQDRVSALNITAKSKDSQVWVDGVPRGKAPLTVEVLPGEHHVLVRTPYGTSGYERIAIGPKSSKDVEIVLQKTRLGITADSKFVRTRETAALYEALSDHVKEADYWLVTGEWQEAIYAALYSPAADSWSEYVRVPLMEAGDDETVEALDELLAMIDNGGSLKRDAFAESAIPLDRSANELLADLLVQAEVPVDTNAAVDDKKKFPVWVIPVAVGGAAALGGGGYGIYRVATHDPNQGRIVIQGQ
ncbi:MAG: PEGA domain-containing protein [Deltaproteobacteria bacterium]|nr:MAG: PEGA domain-containing protein [Deltaproteobacteria bacterium]